VLPETEDHGAWVRWHLSRAQRPRNWYFPRVLCGKVSLKKRAPAYTVGAIITLLFHVEVAGAKGLQLTRMEYNHTDCCYYSVEAIRCATVCAQRLASEGESSGAILSSSLFVMILVPPRPAALVDMQHMISTCGMMHSPASETSKDRNATSTKATQPGCGSKASGGGRGYAPSRAHHPH
jgi:hypothetical protein